MCVSMLGYFLLNFEPVVVEVFAFFLSGPLPSSGPCSKDKEEVKSVQYCNKVVRRWLY